MSKVPADLAALDYHVADAQRQIDAALQPIDTLPPERGTTEYSAFTMALILSDLETLAQSLRRDLQEGGTPRAPSGRRH
jgi:hypothetical protein